MATPLKGERSPLTLVKDAPAATTPEPRVWVVEKRPRAAWRMSSQQLRQWLVYARDNTVDWMQFHVTHSPYYLGWSVRGYRNLCLQWWKAYHDGYRQQIKTAKLMLKQAKGMPRGSARAAEESKARAVLEVRRAEYKAHKKKHWIRTGISGLVVAIGVPIGATVGGLWMQILMALAFILTGAHYGRPAEPAVIPAQAPTRTSHLGEETMRRVLVEAGAVPEKRAAEIRGVGIPHTEGPGIAYAIHTPSGIPASVAVARKQQIAAAMGVHSDWLDLSVGSVETLLQIWVASEDPFGVVRPSPLLDHEGPINTFRDGISIAFGRRGNAIIMHVRDTSLIAAGATRRGKGMLLANILIGVCKDPWVNIRIFDGKGVAEHNPYARILATFVKRNPERLAIISRLIKEEVDRRSDLLDDRGFEKIDDGNYEQAMLLLGGREVFIVDELATYTPKGTSQWDDEITENLSQIAAVGAAVGVLLISITQVPEVAVIRGRLRQNHVGRAAMNTESGTASNTILGDGMTGQGYDASKIPLDQPGRFWLATPETGVVQGRSYLVRPEDKRKVVAEAFELRKAAGRLPGQWRDRIEEQLLAETGASSAAGGQGGKGRIVRVSLLEELETVARAAGRDCATNAEIYGALAVANPAKYGQRDGEQGRAWSTRVGKLLLDELEGLGVDLEAKKVIGPDGQRTLGYQLADILTARNLRI